MTITLEARRATNKQRWCKIQPAQFIFWPNEILKDTQ